MDKMIFQANFQIAAGKEILTRPLIAGFAEFLTLDGMKAPPGVFGKTPCH